MKKIKKSTYKIMAFSAISLALVGCFERKPATEEVSSADTAPSVLRVAMMVPPRSGLSPLSDDAFKLSRWSAAESLTNLNAQGNVEPLLATSWEQVNPMTWNLTLRDQVKFHDGTSLNAKTVVNALQKALNAAPKPRILDGIHWQVSALNDNQIQIKTNFADPLLPSRLSSPQLAILSEKAYLEDGRVVPTNAGTGPFELVEINGATSAKLKRFDDYWGEKAKVETVIAEYVPNGLSRAAALRTGTADVVEAIPVSQAATIDPKLLYEVAMPRTNTLYLNSKQGVFSDKKMRQIAEKAIDRAQLVSLIYENRADVAKGLLGPALAWAAPVRDALPRDAQSDESPRKANGEKIVIGTFTDRAELPEVAVLLEQQLEAAGFNVELDVREYGQIEQDALAGKFDAFILSRATVLDSGDPVAYMKSDFGCDGSFNIGQFCSKEVDNALQFADEQPLGEQRQQAIIAAEQLILSDVAAIPLLHERVLQGENPQVTGVVRDPIERRLIDAHSSVNADSSVVQ